MVKGNHAWQWVCVAGVGVHDRGVGACVQEKWPLKGGTHPTGTHVCSLIFLAFTSDFPWCEWSLKVGLHLTKANVKATSLPGGFAEKRMCCSYCGATKTKEIFTTHKRNCGKVMFSQACVCPQGQVRFITGIMIGHMVGFAFSLPQKFNWDL